MDETKLNAFLLKQLNNALGLLSQHQTIGNTHILYPKSVVDGVIQTLNQVGNTLSQSAQPQPTAEKPPVVVTNYDKVKSKIESKISPPNGK